MAPGGTQPPPGCYHARAMSSPPTQILVTTGPESCGKTTLARDLSLQLGAPLVQEASRDYLEALYARAPGQPYDEQDLLQIARLQLQRELAALELRPARLVCDTDLLVILVWSEVRYGHSSPALQALFEQSLQLAPRHYLLCDHNIPWEADPLREHPHARARLYQLYRDKLQSLKLPHTTVAGSPAQRLQQAWPGRN
jgi:nicotinamide riboside kinase